MMAIDAIRELLFELQRTAEKSGIRLITSEDSTGFHATLVHPETPESLELKLSELVQAASQAGIQVTGCIEIIKSKPCRCGHFEVWIPILKKYACRRCSEIITKAVATGKLTSESQPNIVQALAGTDTIICRDCGGVARRTGMCYTC